jgi:hypothetical protein
LRKACSRQGGREKTDTKGQDISGHQMSGGRASAAGEPGNAAQVGRTVDLKMGEPGEFAFTPERIQNGRQSRGAVNRAAR